MAKYEYLVSYMHGDSPTEVRVSADYVNLNETFVEFLELTGSDDLSGGIVYAINAELLICFDRLLPSAS